MACIVPSDRKSLFTTESLRGETKRRSAVPVASTEAAPPRRKPFPPRAATAARETPTVAGEAAAVVERAAAVAVTAAGHVQISAVKAGTARGGAASVAGEAASCGGRGGGECYTYVGGANMRKEDEHERCR